MSELPKSIVLEGRRYPTWVLSARARECLANIYRVDNHIAELRQRLAFYSAARDECKQQLLNKLPGKPAASPAPRYYWQTAPLEWAQSHWPVKAPTLNLHCLGATNHYREDDRILVYVKGHGAVGWGIVQSDNHSKQLCVAWRFMVAELKEALPAKALSDFSVRHPNRASQMLPPTVDIAGLLQALEARPAVQNIIK
ncbi:hypothetical protein [Halomonas sp.]|uniref:hypothetical protein n=1 Tax=Halomonas sp. TaxID=1486246 RepID=UPI003A8FB464